MQEYNNTFLLILIIFKKFFFLFTRWAISSLIYVLKKQKKPFTLFFDTRWASDNSSHAQKVSWGVGVCGLGDPGTGPASATGGLPST